MQLFKFILNQNYKTDPPVCLLHTSSPSSNALRALGLVDVVQRDRGGLVLPAGQ